MSAFKEQVKKDIESTFLNLDEFSDTHTVNGIDMPCQIDSIEQIKRAQRTNQNMDGIFVQQKLIYVNADDFGPLPKQGSMLRLDKRNYKVVDAIEEGGVYSITIEANRA